ncbi:EAL domain-containing protein [Vibrio sp. 10N.261.55.A7]|uniref:EAL domain-containing protein n=1 Tax=Vibrio sp. 10N.261.55.A7 TaxID=1880851 RepID=UPI000C835484|nr:EAL domain-containing protein [Vibrio sp. 10N.261.55.A7]PMJ90664.1 hypothetical protein BCU12_11535 [Vibrio sp. 10N.261.55.A7]
MTQKPSTSVISSPLKTVFFLIILPLIIVLSATIFLTMSSVQKEMDDNSKAYLHLLDSQIAVLHKNNLEILNKYDECDDLQEEFMFENTSRELILVEEGIAICSSKRGTIHIDLNPFLKPNGSKDGIYLVDINYNPAQRTLFITNTVPGKPHSGIFAIANTSQIFERFNTVANSRSSSVTFKINDKIYPHHNDFSPERIHSIASSIENNFTILVEANPSYAANRLLYSVLRGIAVSLLISLILFLSLQQFRKRLTLVDDLKKGLKRNEFFLCFQPLVNSKNGTINGLEALIRWNHPKLGLIRPDVFIPIAEQQNLVNKITDYVIEEALKDLSNCPSDNDIHLGINVPPSYLHQRNCIDLLEEYRTKFLNIGYVLTIEVTERQMLDQTGRETIKQLRNKGIKISIDDFGTGHTSLSVLQSINFDYLKVDKCFIDTIGIESVSAPVLNTIIDLGDRLGVTIVAEGVETKHQANYLIEKNVPVLQGYYYSKPLPLEDLKQLFKDNEMN